MSQSTSLEFDDIRDRWELYKLTRPDVFNTPVESWQRINWEQISQPGSKVPTITVESATPVTSVVEPLTEWTWTGPNTIQRTIVPPETDSTPRPSLSSPKALPKLDTSVEAPTTSAQSTRLAQSVQERRLRMLGCLSFARATLNSELEGTDDETRKFALAIRSVSFRSLGPIPSVFDILSLPDSMPVDAPDGSESADQGDDSARSEDAKTRKTFSQMEKIEDVHRTMVSIQDFEGSPRCFCHSVGVWDNCVVWMDSGEGRIALTDTSGRVLDQLHHLALSDDPGGE